MASLWLSGQTLTTYSALNFVKVLRENPNNYLLQIKNRWLFWHEAKIDKVALANRQSLTTTTTQTPDKSLHLFFSLYTH
jgi:hypothetical protein